jgi:hypothetical protein
MTRTVQQAAEFIGREIRFGNQFRSGLCKRKTREAYLIPSDGTQDATDAWHRTKHRFKNAWIWGGLIWWVDGTPDPDTGKRHGHVAFMRWRKGHIRSVDFPRVGHWNNTTVTALEKAWPNITFAGTSLDIDGVTVRRMPRFIRRWSHP